MRACKCVRVCVCTCGCVLGLQVWARGCVFIVATIPYSWFNAVNRSTFDKQQKYVKKKKNILDLKIFSPRNFLYLVYPTEKDCLILYNIYTVHPTVQLQRTSGVFIIT